MDFMSSGSSNTNALRSNPENESNTQENPTYITSNSQHNSRAESAGERLQAIDSAEDLAADGSWCPLSLSATGNDFSSSINVEAKQTNDRDRFLPLRHPLNLPVQSLNGECNTAFNVDSASSVLSSRRCVDNTKVSTKEEKQRQNEEKKTPASSSVVDMQLTAFPIESSSSPSANGSWEPIYPQRDSEDQPEHSCTKTHQANEINCFIDASTLLDDGEIAFASTYRSNQPVSSLDSSIGTSKSSKSVTETSRQCSSNIHPQHMFCGNSEVKKSKENLTEDFDRDDTESSVINLSDEQKLSTQKSYEVGNVCPSDYNQRHQTDIKDQYSLENVSTNGPKPISLSMLNELSAREESFKSSNDRHENERKQGQFLFSNSIQQFSGHTMSPKVPYLEENQSDLSLPSIYSGGSDCASTFDTSSHISSDRDSHDFGELSNFSIGNLSKGDSVIFPDTPHNSILQVNLSRNSLGPSDSAIASLSSSESNAISIPSRKSHDDTVPILSGGASIKDFTPKQCESPSMQRKTENCPIISVGMSAMDFEVKSKPTERFKSSAMNTWIVDMSDCASKRNRRRGSESSSISMESNRFSDSAPDRAGSSSSNKGFGYYVSLSDMKSSSLADEQLSKSLNYHSSSSSCASAGPRKKSTGFFVDFSNEDASSNVSQKHERAPSDKPAKKHEDKKNIFSMFIDFGNYEQSESPKNNTMAKPNYNDAQFNETSSEAIVPNRRNQACNMRSSDSDSKRHSWNASKESPQMAHVREHKRSTSTSSDKGIMNILDKIPLISKTSSMSIDTPNSPHDDITFKSLGSYSNNSLTSLSVQSTASKYNEQDVQFNERRHQKDARINETFDKSSQGSITDDILSKNSSSISNTDTDDATFNNDNDETLHGDGFGSVVMETIPETKEAVVLRRPPNMNGNSSKQERHTMESLQATIEKQKQLLNTVTEEGTSFVKLSDMDKPAPKFELHADSRPKSVGSRIGKLFDSRISNRNTWHHMSKSTGNNLSNLASSAENFKSLTRIFPHLGKDLSNSLPINFEHSTSNTSPNEYTMDLFHSDFSTSSATSSISRSGIDSADEFSLSALQPRRLGEDLLKMFLQEIATDVVIEVNGRRMRAHKCILRSRCQYFAAILAGGWVESAGNVISLSGYSYGAVNFALCHIYSGASHPPEGISLMELAALADLLGLEGLKEVAAHSLKTNYCHSFHKPCSGCIDGVMQVFPVALNQGLDDLYRKCLRWACKHYMKVFPSRAFSQLPSELVARCKQHIVAHMTSESVIYTLLDCDHLLALVAPCRWASAVESSVRDIIDAGHVYVTDHYASLIASDGFLSLGQGQSWNISRLENMILRAGSSLTPDQACRSYQRITRLDSVLKAKVNKLHTSRIDKSIFMTEYDNDIDGEDEEDLDWNPDFIRLVAEMIAVVEQCLVRQCSRAMKCNQWQRMDVELQKKIQKLACLTEPVERRANVRPKTTSIANSLQNNRAHDLYQVKMAIQAHAKRTQEGQASIKSTNAQQEATNEHKTNHAPGKVTKSSSCAQVPDLISTIKQAKPNVLIKAGPKPAATAYSRSASESGRRRMPLDKSSSLVDTQPKRPNLHDIKSRYMEPKRQTNSLNKNNRTIRTRSSSGTSRTASPVMSSLIKEGSGNQTIKKPLSDSTTISRDSLASPAKKSDKLLPDRRVSQQCDPDRLSADSLGGSLHSSVITNKTISQESLVKFDARKVSDTKTNACIVRSENTKPFAVKNSPRTGKDAQLKVCGALVSHTSSTVNSSTPSSFTAKTHLSSSNSISSPRDAVINRLTTPAHQIPLRRNAEPKPITKSFLSARSRQILAQKKSLSHSDSSKSVPAVIKDASKLSNPVNKSSSTSSILNQKGKNISTTLHLRRLAKPNSTQQQTTSLPTTGSSKNNVRPSTYSPMNATKTKINSTKMAKPNHKIQRENRTGESNQNTHLEENFSYDNSSNDGSSSISGQRIESKLERSSTFCKERSDINTNELNLVE